ncbi:MAG: endolytic transglycosylase MltG [Thiohalobacteraceae bacterium]
MTEQDQKPQSRPPRGIGDRLFRLAGFLVLAASLVGGWLAFEYRAFEQTSLTVPATGAVLQVPPGRSVRGIAKELAERGILEHPRFLEWMARWSGDAARLQAGEYRIEPGTPPAALIQKLVAGKVMQHSLTLVEGWTFEQLLVAVRAHPVLRQTLQDKSAAEIMAALGHPDEHPEGRFLPDTYHFPRGMTDLEFLRRAYRAMQRELERAWATRAEGLPIATPYEALILASIIEKETGLAEERARIAGVFVRRLQKGMRLQTDPTVIYGLGKDFDGNIRRRDLRADTEYNSYTRGGLPPTPIALPGKDSLHAALHPEDGDELFFVGRGDGSHQFSATLQEHNRAVRKYQLKR